MSKTIAVHVRYKSALYVSWPSSGKQESKMTQFYAVYETWTGWPIFRTVGIERRRCIFSF